VVGILVLALMLANCGQSRSDVDAQSSPRFARGEGAFSLRGEIVDAAVTSEDDAMPRWSGYFIVKTSEVSFSRIDCDEGPTPGKEVSMPWGNIGSLGVTGFDPASLRTAHDFPRQLIGKRVRVQGVAMDPSVALPTSNRASEACDLFHVSEVELL
jgi:hypothetical protein